MKLDEGIRTLGFRKWYERELLQSHAHMALAFVCVIGVFAAFEASSIVQHWADRLMDVFAVFVCGATGIWSLRRYLRLLGHAEAVANQADCPSCKAYARFELRAVPADGVRVRCRQCGHEWTIFD